MLMLLYRIYQILIMCPVVVVATIITAVITAAGSALGLGLWCGYYPEIYWARLFCWLNFVTVSVKGTENIDSKTSYVFVANHQGAFDIFSLFGWLGHNFRWMMKQSLRKIPFVGWACKASGQILSTIPQLQPHATPCRTLKNSSVVECHSQFSPKVPAHGTARCVVSKKVPSALL